MAFHFYHDLPSEIRSDDSIIKQSERKIKKLFGFLDKYSHFSKRDFSLWIKLIKSIQKAYINENNEPIVQDNEINLNHLGNLLARGLNIMVVNFNRINDNNFCYLLFVISMNHLRTATLNEGDSKKIISLFFDEFNKRKGKMKQTHLSSTKYSFGRANIKNESLITHSMQLFKDPTNYDNLNKTSLKEKVNIVMYSGLYLSGFKNSSILEDFEKITDVLVNLYNEIETSKEKGNYFAIKKTFVEFLSKICLNLSKQTAYNEKIINISFIIILKSRWTKNS